MTDSELLMGLIMAFLSSGILAFLSIFAFICIKVTKL